ncbi:hypothetical protein [Nocardia carnea]|nr:hypothetical protein [Nocardia carnea]
MRSDVGRRAEISERAVAHGRMDTASRLVDLVLAAPGGLVLRASGT